MARIMGKVPTAGPTERVASYFYSFENKWSRVA